MKYELFITRNWTEGRVKKHVYIGSLELHAPKLADAQELTRIIRDRLNVKTPGEFTVHMYGTAPVRGEHIEVDGS